MVNPGAFGGSRKAFLVSQKPDYSAGVMGGYAADALALIQRKYFKRFPIDLPHNEEPTNEWLMSVNDDETDPDQVPPDIESLGEEDYIAAKEALEERQKLLAFRKAVSEYLCRYLFVLKASQQIKRWLAYQYMKDHDIDPHESGAHNPYRTLLHQLTGTTIQKPQQKSAVNIWRKTQRKEIDLEAKKITENGNIPRSKHAAV